MIAPTLTDGVVTLRAASDDDLDRVVEQSRDPESIRWTTVPVPYSLDDAKRFVRHTIPGGWASDEEWAFSVEHEARFAGTVILRNRGEGRGEVAFGSHPDVRGLGVMSRALRLLLEWGFTPVAEGGRGLHVVTWLAHRGNWSSRRLAWATGFSFDGIRAGWFEHRGERRDMWMGCLRRGEAFTPRTPWLESVVLRGESVVLRALSEADLPRIVETLNDADVQHWLQRPRDQAPHTLESDADFLLLRREQAASGSAVHWAVADASTDAYVAQLSLVGYQHRREAELAYWAHPGSRGRGFVTEAVRLLVRHCFVAWEDGGLGLRRLTADAALGNVASQTVLERCGFVRTGVSRQDTLLADGTWTDSVTYDQLAPAHLAG